MNNEIKEQVLLTDKGIITSGIPLYAKYHETKLDSVDGYSISISNDKPLAYLMYVGEENPLQIINANLILKHCEVLGEL